MSRVHVWALGNLWLVLAEMDGLYRKGESIKLAPGGGGSAVLVTWRGLVPFTLSPLWTELSAHSRQTACPGPLRQLTRVCE